jgi:hypothetical protein
MRFVPFAVILAAFLLMAEAMWLAGHEPAKSVTPRNTLAPISKSSSRAELIRHFNLNESTQSAPLAPGVRVYLYEHRPKDVSERWVVQVAVAEPIRAEKPCGPAGSRPEPCYTP